MMIKVEGAYLRCFNAIQDISHGYRDVITDWNG
jgi:hypothetical protein